MPVKLSNNYAAHVAQYSAIPKAVFAAIAFSYCSSGGELDDEKTNANILREWWILYENGIVPQKPHAPKPADD